jgi:hypothetical protein
VIAEAEARQRRLGDPESALESTSSLKQPANEAIFFVIKVQIHGKKFAVDPIFGFHSRSATISIA